MANPGTVRTRPITRDKLANLFNSPEMIRLVENLTQDVGTTLPTNTQQAQTAADGAATTIGEHVSATSGAHSASAISNAPAGGITATNVQGALNELDSELSAFVSNLGSMAAQNASAVAITGGTVLLASGALGYATGNGGTVTQATSKSTGVALNKACGEITMNASALAAGSAVIFHLTNTAIAAGDRIAINHVSGGTFGSYHIDGRCSAGAADIVVRNIDTVSLSEAIVLGFTIIKSATS